MNEYCVYFSNESMINPWSGFCVLADTFEDAVQKGERDLDKHAETFSKIIQIQQLSFGGRDLWYK